MADQNRHVGVPKDLTATYLANIDSGDHSAAVIVLFSLGVSWAIGGTFRDLVQALVTHLMCLASIADALCENDTGARLQIAVISTVLTMGTTLWTLYAATAWYRRLVKHSTAESAPAPVLVPAQAPGSAQQRVTEL